MRRVVFFAVMAATLLPAAIGSAETAGEKRVAQQIGSHLKQSGQLQNYRVGVKFHDGVAYLNGSVSSPEQRDTAVELAQQVEGVSHVVCKLEVPSSSQADAGKTEAAGNADRRELSQELDKASYEGAQSDSAEVKQAFQQSSEQAGPIRQIGQQQNPQLQQMQQMQQMQMMQMQRQAARMPAPQQARRGNMPVPYQRMPGMMPVRQASASTGVNQAACSSCNGGGGVGMGGPGMMGPGMGDGGPTGFAAGGPGGAGMTDNPQMPGYAWPSYASYPNYAALSYPQQYSPTAWPYIGPFYPYPQVPLAWRKVSLEWDDGWWFLDFSSHNSSH